MKMGYLGLSRPYDAVWSDGTRVTIHPDGRIVNRETNGVTYAAGWEPSPVCAPPMGTDTSKFLIFGITALVAIVALVALKR